MNDRTSPGAAEHENEEYQTLAILEELESLLEDLEDNGITGISAGVSIPDDIRQRMERLGIHDVMQLRDKLMHLHAQVDEDDADLTITDS